MTDDERRALSRRAVLSAGVGTVLSAGAAGAVGAARDAKRRSDTDAGANAGALDRGRPSGAAGGPAQDEAWRGFQFEAGNTGAPPADWTAVGTPMEKRWTFEAEGQEGPEIYVPPAVVDGTVYAPTREGGIYALDAATGEQRWRFDSVGLGAPAVADGTVFVGSGDGFFYALDAESGEKIWERETLYGQNSDFGATYVDGRVYALSEPEIAALDPETGEAAWTARTPGFVGRFSAPAVADDLVFVTGIGFRDEPDVVAYDAATGEQVWEFATESNVVDDTGQGVYAPTVADGTLYFGGEWERGFFALDAATGEERWRIEEGETYASPAVADGTVYVALSNPYRVVALDPASGEFRWETRLGEDRTLASPVVVGDTVYSVGGGTLTALATDDGTVRGEVGIGGPDNCTPAVVDGTVYVGGTRFHAIERDTATPTAADTPTPGDTPTPDGTDARTPGGGTTDESTPDQGLFTPVGTTGGGDDGTADGPPSFTAYLGSLGGLLSLVLGIVTGAGAVLWGGRVVARRHEGSDSPPRPQNRPRGGRRTDDRRDRKR